MTAAGDRDRTPAAPGESRADAVVSLERVNAGQISIGPISRHQHFHGESYARSRYRVDIDDLLVRYHTSFVGREGELTKVRAFAAARAPGYLLVEAGGGMGKSALLAELLLRAEQRRESPALSVVAYFVRDPGARYPGEFLSAVNAQLLTLLGRTGGTPYDLLALRNQFSELWAQAQTRASAENPLVLLVDGLDEQAGGEVTIGQLLPESLRDWVHVVVSSRPRPDAREQVALGHPLRRAEPMLLGPLSPADVQAMLVADGLAQPAAAAVAARVHAVARGEALLAHFLCEDIVARGTGALDAYEKDPPRGIQDYFLRAVRAIDTAADATWQACALIAAALGPLSLDEMADILQTTARAVRRSLEPVDRYLIGDRRLQLFHRNLYTAMLDELGHEAREWRGRLSAWCARRARGADPVPPYVLEHFARHLAEEGDTAGLVTLIDRPWLDAHRKAFGVLTRFAQDVDLACQLSSDAARRGAGPQSSLVDTLRMAVVLWSLGTLAQNVPPRAIWLLARLGRTDDAGSYAELAADATARIASLAALGQAFAEQAAESQASAVFERALQLEAEHRDTYGIDRSLAALVQATNACAGVAATEGVLQALVNRPVLDYEVEQIAAGGVNLALRGEKESTATLQSWFGGLLDQIEAQVADYVQARAQRSARVVEASAGPQHDEENFEERENYFYRFVDRAARACLTFAARAGAPALAERTERLISSLDHEGRSSELLAAAAQSSALRGDLGGALALAQAAARWPFEPSSTQAFVPALFQLSQLALCVAQLSASCFSELRGQLVEQMRALADALANENQASGYSSLATAYGATGRHDELVQLLERSGDPAMGNDYTRAGLRAEIALAMLACGDLDGAVRALDAVPNPAGRDQEARALIDGLLARGRSDLAERVLAKIDYPPNRIAALAELGADAFRRGDREGAARWLERVIAACTVFDDASTRVSLFAQAGRALARVGAAAQARRCADRALALKAPLAADGKATGVSLAMLSAELGDSTGFLSFAPRRADVWGMRYLLRYAHALVVRGDTATLAAFFDSLPSSAPATDLAEYHALRAHVLLLMGRTQQASEAAKAANEASDSALSPPGLADVAMAGYLAAAGDTAGALAAIERGVRRIRDDWLHRDSLGTLAKACADLGHHERAAVLAREALATFDFSMNFTERSELGEALACLPAAEIPRAIEELSSRARAGGSASYVRHALTQSIHALQARGLDKSAAVLLLDTLPLYRTQPRSEMLWNIAELAPLLARLDPEGLLRLCDWVEQVTGWWERAQTAD